MVALRPVQKLGDAVAEKSCYAIPEAEVNAQAMQENVEIGKNGIISVDGMVSAPKGYLARIKPMKKATLSVEGFMEEGRLALSVLDENKGAWVENSLLGMYRKAEYFSYIREVEAHQALIVSSNMAFSGEKIVAHMAVRSCE